MAFSINTPYVTIEEASQILEDVAIWEDAEPTDQQRALEMGRQYIDENYTCIYFDETDAPDAVKIANANLAVPYLTDPSSFLGSQSQTGLTKNRVKAGSVESEKEFDPYLIDGQDPYPNITLTLSSLCSYNGAQRNITR